MSFSSSQALFEHMKAQNDSTWYQHFTFKQHTYRFDDKGQPLDSTIWHEAVSYPYLFRIDRDINEGVYTIYRNDSTYNFKNDTLVSALDQPAKHLLMKGGLYFVSVKETLDKLVKYGYDVESFRKDTLMGEDAYVIGDTGNEFWLHASNFYCMRRVYTTPSGKIVNVVYEDYKQLGKGWVEQKVSFYVDEVKRLEEFYFDIELKSKIEEGYFKPSAQN